MLVALFAVLLVQPGCINKLWKKDAKKKAEKVHNVYGSFVSQDNDVIVVETKKGEATFLMGDASIKGGDFEPGATVHVYYKIRENGNVVTMVVEKIK